VTSGSNRYRLLHELSPAQTVAADVLDGGGSASTTEPRWTSSGDPLRDVQQAASHATLEPRRAMTEPRISRPACHLHRVHLRRRRQPLNDMSAVNPDRVNA
jgi:hypothetical protein